MRAAAARAVAAAGKRRRVSRHPALPARAEDFRQGSKEGPNNSILEWFRRRGIRPNLSPFPPNQSLARLIRERALPGARNL
jgi:hypothetical protein